MQDETAEAERQQEDMDDLAVAAERRKETPIPWDEAKKKLSPPNAGRAEGERQAAGAEEA